MRQMTRRTVLGGVAATALAGAAAPAAATSGLPRATADVGHATPRVARLVESLFRDKTSRSVERTMAHFSRAPMFYTDATLGWYMPTWEALKAVFEQRMPTWPATARSYPTRIIGDERSAIVLFTNTPELFGNELRTIAAVDFRDGQVVRQADYWDGRHFGIDATAALRVPADQFPATFGEDVVRDQSSPTLRTAVSRLHAALDRGDTTGLFTADAAFEDLTLRTRIVGRQAIDAYVMRAAATLPYGRGATIRHTLGNHLGGGYEWTSDRTAVARGIIAVELDREQRISRFTTTWDGSLLDDTAMTALLATTLER